jgi:hypothetical protein
MPSLVAEAGTAFDRRKIPPSRRDPSSRVPPLSQTRR